MRRLGKYVKNPDERKQYNVDYQYWLGASETILTVAYAFVPATGMTVDGSAISADHKSISYFVSGGDDGATYELVITITTSGGQTKEDAVLYVVRAL